jgi:cytochrome P450
VILESIRLSYGVSARMARIAPEETLIYKGEFLLKRESKAQEVTYKIPPGTPVSMDIVSIHSNESIYPQHDQFIPERWLKEDGSRRTELETYFFSFSKGTRSCLGIK